MLESLKHASYAVDNKNLSETKVEQAVSLFSTLLEKSVARRRVEQANSLFYLSTA